MGKHFCESILVCRRFPSSCGSAIHPTFRTLSLTLITSPQISAVNPGSITGAYSCNGEKVTASFMCLAIKKDTCTVFIYSLDETGKSPNGVNISKLSFKKQ